MQPVVRLLCLLSLFVSWPAISFVSAQPHSEEAPMTPSFSFTATSFEVRDTPEAVVIETPRFEISLGREGYGLTVRRAGEVVLQSAQPGDAAGDAGFDVAGTPHVLTALEAFERDGDAVVLTYATSLAGATARITLRPYAEGAHVAVRLIGA